MEKQTVKIASIDKITHDVLRIVTEKPVGFTFTPGQTAEISINKKVWANEKRTFSFTSLPENDYLEFNIKTYPSHKGVTNELLELKKDEELILHDVFGLISYHGEGVFIAGGSGITPFISIFRYLESANEIGNNKLIFANKTKDDIILYDEFNNLLGENFINILSDEEIYGYANGFITDDFLKTYVNNSIQNIYLCGPPEMMDAVKKQLTRLGIDRNVITEEEI